MSQDMCKTVRRSYTSILTFLTHNQIIALSICSLSPLFSSLFIAYYASDLHVFLSFAITLVVTLWFLWFIAVVTIWKMAPNALSISIIPTQAIAHWLTINLILMIWYNQYRISWSVYGLTVPLLFLLNISIDIQRELRARLYRRFVELVDALPPPTGARKESI